MGMTPKAYKWNAKGITKKILETVPMNKRA
jgi:hypothetical protein